MNNDEFEEWWKENIDDFPDEDTAKEVYKEILEETGEVAWSNMDEDDREGWQDNLVKSFD